MSTSAPRLTMYSKSGCVWCDRMRTLLSEKGLSFVEVKVDAEIENLEELKRRVPSVRTVPQLLSGDTIIGGYEATVEYLKGEENASG